MNKHGQSIVEYVLIAILVIVGIVFMGPYVLRSINAHFKLWDEGVQDSFEEHLAQAPVNAVPPINVNCECSLDVGSCGGTGLLCPVNEREIDYDCHPQGCNQATQKSTCTKPDPTCCTKAAPTGGCGTIPLGQPTTSTNCNIGQAIWAYECGTNTNVQCVNDTKDCPLPQCKGYIQYPNSTYYCETQSTTPPSSIATLTQDTNYTYVDEPSAQNCGINSNCTSCNGSSPCQMYCQVPYVLDPTGTFCTTHPPQECSGEGLIQTSGNDCIDDGGSDSTNDSLEIYCHNHIIRLCLSGERCPWRTGGNTSCTLQGQKVSGNPDTMVCSPCGLSAGQGANGFNGSYNGLYWMASAPQGGPTSGNLCTNGCGLTDYQSNYDQYFYCSPDGLSKAMIPNPNFKSRCE